MLWNLALSVVGIKQASAKTARRAESFAGHMYEKRKDSVDPPSDFFG